MNRRFFVVACAAAGVAGCTGTGSLLPNAMLKSAHRSYYLVRPLPRNPIVGEVRPFEGTHIPSDWLLCDGRSLSAKAYADLYAVLGHSAGRAPKGTFKLPNPKSARFVIAAHGLVPRTPHQLRAAMASRNPAKV